MTEIENMGDGWHRIPIPVPFPMKYMYAYAAVGQDGVDLIDAGFHTSDAKQAWKDAFAQLQIQPSDVRTIYMTHFHPDHFGLAGWMQEWTKAPVKISRTDMDRVRLVWGNGSVMAEQIGEMAFVNGAPRELADEIVRNMLKLGERVVPLPEMTPLEGDEATIGGEPWRVFPTPGHSDGHLCFYHSGRRRLIAGDHLLDPITPNISTWPEGSCNPLRLYLNSLRRTAELDIDVSYGGHGKPIPNVQERIGQLIGHHEKRLEKMLHIAKDGKTAYETAAELFRDKALTAHQWRFAIAETISHLDYLLAEGKLVKDRQAGITLYREKR